MSCAEKLTMTPTRPPPPALTRIVEVKETPFGLTRSRVRIVWIKSVFAATAAYLIRVGLTVQENSSVLPQQILSVFKHHRLNAPAKRANRESVLLCISNEKINA